MRNKKNQVVSVDALENVEVKAPPTKANQVAPSEKKNEASSSEAVEKSKTRDTMDETQLTRRSSFIDRPHLKYFLMCEYPYATKSTSAYFYDTVLELTQILGAGILSVFLQLVPAALFYLGKEQFYLSPIDNGAFVISIDAIIIALAANKAISELIVQYIPHPQDMKPYNPQRAFRYMNRFLAPDIFIIMPCGTYLLAKAGCLALGTTVMIDYKLLTLLVCFPVFWNRWRGIWCVIASRGNPQAPYIAARCVKGTVSSSLVLVAYVIVVTTVISSMGNITDVMRGTIVGVLGLTLKATLMTFIRFGLYKNADGLNEIRSIFIQTAHLFDTVVRIVSSAASTTKASAFLCTLITIYELGERWSATYYATRYLKPNDKQRRGEQENRYFVLFAYESTANMISEYSAIFTCFLLQGVVYYTDGKRTAFDQALLNLAMQFGFELLSDILSIMLELRMGLNLVETWKDASIFFPWLFPEKVFFSFHIVLFALLQSDGTISLEL